MSPFEIFNFDVGCTRRGDQMKSNLYQVLGQVPSSDAGQIFRDQLRGCVRQMTCEVMAAEADELCRVRHLTVNTFVLVMSANRTSRDGGKALAISSLTNFAEADTQIFLTYPKLSFQVADQKKFETIESI